MRGPGFLYLHPKMDELLDSLNANLDEMSERLITIGGAPYSTLAEFSKHSKLDEAKGTYDKTVAQHLARLVEVYLYLSSLYQVGLDITDEEGDAGTNDLFTAAKTEAEKPFGCSKQSVDKAQHSNGLCLRIKEVNDKIGFFYGIIDSFSET